MRRLNKARVETSKFDFLTIDDASRILKISKVQLWKLRRSGAINFILVGNKAIFRREDIEQFVKDNSFSKSKESHQ